MSKKDQNYEATRLHFENLAKRYGNPIIILNLIKVIAHLLRLPSSCFASPSSLLLGNSRIWCPHFAIFKQQNFVKGYCKVVKDLQIISVTRVEVVNPIIRMHVLIGF